MEVIISILLYVAGFLLYVAFLLLCLGIFSFLLLGSLLIGSIGGVFIGTFKGFKNYFSALAQNLKLRK